MVAKSRVVIHVSGGVANVASVQGDVDVHILDFDGFAGIEGEHNLSKEVKCPHCGREGSVDEWVVATLLTLNDVLEDDPVQLDAFQKDADLYCAYCLEPSNRSMLSI